MISPVNIFPTMNDVNHIDIDTLISGAPVGICIMDARTLISETTNESFLKVAGKSREQIVGRYYWDSFAEAAPFYETALSEVVSTGTSFHATEVEVMLIRNGKEENIFVTFVYSPVMNRYGKVEKVIVWVIENTSQVRSRQLLQDAKWKVEAAERTLRSMIMQAPVAMAVLLGHEHTIAMANPMMLELWGRPAVQLMNKPVFEAIPEAKDQGLEFIMNLVYSSGETYWANEKPVKLARHGRIEMVYRNFVYEPYKDIADNTIGIIAITTDVTEQVMARQKVEKLNEHLLESEERFRLMAEGSGILITLSDETGNITYLSKAWSDLTGIPENEMINMSWTDLLHQEDKAGYLDAWFTAFEYHKTFKAEFRILDKNREYRWLLANGSPRFRADQRFTGYISSCADITEQKELQQRKDDFISIASHELKTPVTSLKASIQLMERQAEQASPEVLNRLIAQANRSVDKVSRLINELLSVSRLTRGHIPLNKTFFRISDLLNNCCMHVREDNKHELRFEGDIEQEIYADEHRIEQVIINFVNNAMKYAPDSRVIYFGVKRVENDIKISVRDTGPGISPKQQPYLFERYYRVDHHFTNNSGIGLGLYISAEIVNRHGGTIGIDSVPGSGSTFWFTLPV